jgi:hypothetical protein
MPVPNTQLTYTVYRREQWRWYDYWEDEEYDWLPDEDGEGYGDYDRDYGQVVQTGELTTDSAGRATLMLRTNELLPTKDYGGLPVLGSG